MRPNWEIVLRALTMYDAKIEMPDGLTYAMVDGNLCIQLLCWTKSSLDDMPDEERWVVWGGTFNQFMRDCEKLSKEKIQELVLQNTLVSMRKDRNRERR